MLPLVGGKLQQNRAQRFHTGVLISPYPNHEGKKLMFLSEWREFTSALCLAGKKNLMTARISMLFKSRVSLTCFRVSFLPGRAKDLSAPGKMRGICLLTAALLVLNAVLPLVGGKLR